MHVKRIDFVIIILFIVAIILSLDNWVLGDDFFNLSQLHHETFIVALVFGGVLLLLFRKKGLL